MKRSAAGVIVAIAIGGLVSTAYGAGDADKAPAGGKAGGGDDAAAGGAAPDTSLDEGADLGAPDKAAEDAAQ